MYCVREPAGVVYVYYEEQQGGITSKVINNRNLRLEVYS